MLSATITPPQSAALAPDAEDFFDVLLREQRPFIDSLSNGQLMMVREFIDNARAFLKESGKKELKKVSTPFSIGLTTTDGKTLLFHLRDKPLDMRRPGGHASITKE